MSSLERKARIFNVQKYNTADGPGVRTLVFFQGCPLRCKWCANPEGLERKYRVMMKYNLCIDCGKCVQACPQGIHQIDPESFIIVSQVQEVQGRGFNLDKHWKPE